MKMTASFRGISRKKFFLTSLSLDIEEFPKSNLLHGFQYTRKSSLGRKNSTNCFEFSPGVFLKAKQRLVTVRPLKYKCNKQPTSKTGKTVKPLQPRSRPCCCLMSFENDLHVQFIILCCWLTTLCSSGAKKQGFEIIKGFGHAFILSLQCGLNGCV